MWNLDETDTMPSNDAKWRTRLKQYMRRCGTRTMRVPEFVRTSRATVLPVLRAERQAIPPFYVFKGSCLPYREVSVDSKVEVQTYATFLPRGTMLEMHEEAGVEESTNLYSWALKFVDLV